MNMPFTEKEVSLKNKHRKQLPLSSLTPSKRLIKKIVISSMTAGIIMTGSFLGGPANEVHACDYATYEVKKSDTYWSLAAKYGVTVGQLQEANKQKKLINGDTIVVPPPNKDEPCTEVALKGEAIEQPDGTVKYKVVKGDTLTQIARAFHTTMEHIQAANYMPSAHINPGQMLTVTNLQKAEVKTDTVTITGAADSTSLEVQASNGQYLVLQASGSAVQELGFVKEGTKAAVTYTNDKVPTLVSYKLLN
ncbi:MAG TPA: LysM peptidoglycan-binding domain-containing protein [Bacillus sp. (in: firmicutes)]|nr:LysM peptidoglycan-binding domain-containing protein [Bacillus sp. (in: firmicutes)]